MKAHVALTFCALVVCAFERSAAAGTLTSAALDVQLTDTSNGALTSSEAGNIYWYNLSYSLNGTDFAGVGATITVDLPDGLWVTDNTAPAAFTRTCTRNTTGDDIANNVYRWKFACTFTAANLGLTGDGTRVGEVRVQVRSQRYAIAHNTLLQANASLSVTGSTPSIPGDTASPSITITATPAATVTQEHSAFNHPYRQMMGPNGVIGTTFDYEIQVNNVGSAQLNNVSIQQQLPAGTRIVSLQPGLTLGTGSAWSLASSPWTENTVTLTRTGTWGRWTRILNGAVQPTSQIETFTVTLWTPCTELANFPTIHPDDSNTYASRRHTVTLSATGTDPSAPPSINAANSIAPPRLGLYTCDPLVENGAYANMQGGGGREPGSEAPHNYLVWPAFGLLTQTDALVWLALGPNLSRFSAAANADPQFTRYFCNLSGLDTNPVLVHANFLAADPVAWKDDTLRCTTTQPTTPAQWQNVTHVFFHAPVWGITTSPAPEGASVGFLNTTFSVVISPDATHDADYQVLGYFESTEVALRSRPRTGKVNNLSRPRLFRFYATLPNAPFVSPAQTFTYVALPHRAVDGFPPGNAFNNVRPANPVVELDLPPGILYQSSQVVFGQACIDAQNAPGVLPNTWIPQVYTPNPTITLLVDGSTRLRWKFGDSAARFALNGACPGQTGSGPGNSPSEFTQITILTNVKVDPNRFYVDQQVLDATGRMEADNEAPDYPDALTFETRMNRPAELSVQVLPRCEELGDVGFGVVFRNTGGRTLEELNIRVPIPETFDPAGTPYDTTTLSAAVVNPPLAGSEVQYSVDSGSTWNPAAPTPLTSTSDVRLAIPSLAPLTPEYVFLVDLVPASPATGNGTIHARTVVTSQTLSDSDASSEIPFVLETCPQWLEVTKFFDSDRDGVKDPTELALAGWSFSVALNGTPLATRTTDFEGRARFVVEPGTYTVTEAVPPPTNSTGPNWTATTQAGGALFQNIVVPLSATGVTSVSFGNVCDCDDGNACTEDSCDPLLGCLLSQRVCDDDNACTSNTCNPASGCEYPTTVTCPPGPECQLNQCQPATGTCALTAMDNGTACNDGVACTSNDICTGGNCAGADACAETQGLCGVGGACNLASGACTYDDVECVQSRFYALVENSAGVVVGAIICDVGPPIVCDVDDDDVLLVYEGITTCGGNP